MSLYNTKFVHMKYLFNILLLCLSINCFAEEILPPEPSGPDGIIGGHEYVDLGLPSGTLWATYNVGATSPYESGSFFAWGEVEPREDFSWQSYKFFRGVEIDTGYGQWAILEDIGSNICGTEYDAARHQWGNGWRLPNERELYELRMRCWSKYTTENGVSGVRVYGPNEHSIFLRDRCVGLWNGIKDPCDATNSYYWCGEDMPQFTPVHTPIEPSNIARGLLVQSQTTLQCGDISKASGICVRAVVNPKESGIDKVADGSDNKITLSYRDGCLHISGNADAGTISVYDLSGRLIFSVPVSDNICRLSGVSTGMYIVSFTNNGNMLSTQKLTVK